MDSSSSNVISGEQVSRPIRGQFCGKVKGPETRSDGSEFEGEWIVFVQFADDGTLQSVSELFEFGKPYEISAIGVPISREESGEDFYALRQLTPLESRQSDGFAEVVIAYQRWDQFIDDDGPRTYWESHGAVTLRFTPAGKDLHCELQRDWHNELPQYDSSWTASGYLERDGRPKPMFSGSYRFMPDNVAYGYPLRFRFNEFGRVVELGYCDYEHDRNFHGGTWPKQAILDIRYRADSIVVETESRYPPHFVPADRYTGAHYLTNWQNRRHELWPWDEGISANTVFRSVTDFSYSLPDFDVLDQTIWDRPSHEYTQQFLILPDNLNPQAAGTWSGEVSGELYTRQPDGTYVVSSLARPFTITFDATGFPMSISIGERSFSVPCTYHGLRCDAEGVYIDHRFGFTVPEPQGQERIFLTWPRDGVIHCDIVKTNDWSNGPEARWAASGRLTRG